MPSLNSKALLLELDTYVADNNVRRGVLTTATNALSPDGTLNDRHLLVDTGLEDPINIECLPNNQLTVFKCTGGPLRVTAKIGSNVQAIEFDVASMWVMSSEIKELAVINTGTRRVQLRIIQI